MASEWLDKLKKAEKTCLIQDGKRRVHYTFCDGKEMAEEYDMKTNALIARKWRQKSSLGALGRWEVEVGDPEGDREWKLESDGFRENVSNPTWVRKDTPVGFQWRIRNLPYPYSVYQVRIDETSRHIIVSTSNKKYYKKFNIPDLDRAKLPLESKRLSFSHGNNTLIITYEKPPAILEMEKAVQEQLKKMKASKDGDVECKPS